MSVRREQMVTTSQFLDSARNLGINTIEGVCEVLDNSFDADAWNVRVHIERAKDDSLQFTFTDDGVGIPRTHTDEEGVERQGIPYILAYGGRIPHPHQEAPVGKFGWGLSQTACCLSKRTEVYTKTEDDDNWRFGYYDFAELEKDPEIMLPVEKEAEPPWFELPERGTIIWMREVDQSEYKLPNAIHGALVANLGRIYRYFLVHGRTITVSYRDGKAHRETKVGINDPLMIMDESREVKLAGPSFDGGEVEMVFDGDHPLGPILEPDGNPATLYAKFVRLDVETIRRSLDLPLSGAGGLTNKLVKEKLGISSDTSGFSVIRNGREIGHGRSLGMFTKGGGQYNYFRAEIRFSAALDGVFKVRTNKSRFDATQPFKEIIKEEWGKIVSSIEYEIANERKRLSNSKQDDEVPRAERVAAKAAPNLIRKKVKTADRDKARKEIQAEVAQRVQAVRDEAEKKSNAAIKRAEEAEARGDKVRASEARTESQVVMERAVTREERILNRFAFDSPCRKEKGSIGTGELYNVRSRGDEAWITINTDTPFFTNVYSQAERKPDFVDLLDLMIFSMGYSEHIQDTSPEIKGMWENARREVSALASQMVGTMAISALTDVSEGGDE